MLTRAAITYHDIVAFHQKLSVKRPWNLKRLCNFPCGGLHLKIAKGKKNDYRKSSEAISQVKTCVCVCMQRRLRAHPSAWRFSCMPRQWRWMEWAEEDVTVTERLRNFDMRDRLWSGGGRSVRRVTWSKEGSNLQLQMFHIEWVLDVKCLSRFMALFLSYDFIFKAWKWIL